MHETTSAVPQHVAIIPDGNRRWARSRGLEPWKGHEEGVKTMKELIKAARDLGVRELSLWGSSLENLKKRPMDESRELLRIYSEQFRELSESEELVRDQVRVRIIGRWRQQFPSSLIGLLSGIEEKTREHTGHFLNFFLAYSGVDDMLQAFRSAAARSLHPEDITEETVKGMLMSQEVAPVDLLIRTGGDAHLSAGFLMWETSDSQLVFSEKLFPDFGKDSLQEAVEEYSGRERRFGK
ncbi:MAG: di-trans,poly-cis-decaprenylcistransferase [Candidatus Moranbacteria bacterium]|nr:di-trans,poly-cis-decaprenylcistransferase [Candidatus Moranbacteria bacterium]NTW75394.1 di-trans,poly-cis-decaprenylcistransferase [Candidatus Moranbacteria bacterium]